MDAPSTSSSTQAPTQRRRGQNSKKPGQGRGRGGSNGGGGGQQDEGAGRNDHGRQGHGRGGRGNNGTRASDIATVGGKSIQDGNTSGMQFIPQSAYSKPAAAGTQDEDDNDDVEAEVCFICASPVVHNSVAPCNHRTCHICALRMRALYGTKACAHCRANAEFVIFTDEPEKRFEDYAEADFNKTDTVLGIKYEKKEIYEDTLLLLRYNCPDESCDVACYGWPDLHRHVKGAHHKVLCDLCTRYKKVFTHEHELFTHASLTKHQRYGDDTPGAADQSGFKGHPECGFCNQRFYGDDELYVHCREKHERCHICDRRNNGRNTAYYDNYDTLETHFGRDHFLCADKECLEKKFVVFESEMDLKAHQLEAHPHGLDKDARRDARRVDMSGFDYRSSHAEDSRGNNSSNRRQGRGGRGRGRDPNADPIPQSSAQPLSRAELAYQRQLAIHSAQSVSTRTFGGQLTSTDGPLAARPQSNTRAPPTVTAPREATHSQTNGTNNVNPTATLSSSLSSLDLGSTPAHLQSSGSMSQADRARQQRHAYLTERCSNLLQNDQAKLTSFRAHVSSFRSSAVSAPAFVDALFALFSTTSTTTAELGTVVKELAELFEVPGKKEALLAAWNDWRAINEDYPDLPGAPAAGGAVSTGGKRILKLKSSTAPSSRAAAVAAASSSSSSRPATLGWASTLGAGHASRPPARDAFPGLPPSSGGGSGTSTPAGRPSWLATTTATSSASSSRTPSRPSSTRPQAATTAPPSSDAASFPALPANTPKPRMNISRPGYAGGPSLRGTGGGQSVAANAWLAASSTAPEPAPTEDEEESGKKKQKGRKKQVLMGWG